MKDGQAASGQHSSKEGCRLGKSRIHRSDERLSVLHEIQHCLQSLSSLRSCWMLLHAL